jgi:hypothetical protein
VTARAASRVHEADERRPAPTPVPPFDDHSRRRGAPLRVQQLDDCGAAVLVVHGPLIAGTISEFAAALAPSLTKIQPTVIDLCHCDEVDSQRRHLRCTSTPRVLLRLAPRRDRLCPRTTRSPVPPVAESRRRASAAFDLGDTSHLDGPTPPAWTSRAHQPLLYSRRPSFCVGTSMSPSSLATPAPSISTVALSPRTEATIVPLAGAGTS